MYVQLTWQIFLSVSVYIHISLSQVALEGQISRKSAMKSLSDGYQPHGDQIPWKFCEQFWDPDFPRLSGARIATHPSAMRVNLCFMHVLSCLVVWILIKHFDTFLLVYEAWIWFCCCWTLSKVNGSLNILSLVRSIVAIFPQCNACHPYPSIKICYQELRLLIIIVLVPVVMFKLGNVWLWVERSKLWED